MSDLKEDAETKQNKKRINDMEKIISKQRLQLLALRKELSHLRSEMQGLNDAIQTLQRRIR